MKLIKFFGLLAYHLVSGTIRAGSFLVNLALDCVYGPPQIASSAGTQHAPHQSSPQQVAGDFKPAVQLAPTLAVAATTEDHMPPAPQLLGRAPPAVAERVRTAQLCGPQGIVYGRMWLYLYPDLKLAKRVLKLTDPHLAKILKRERFYLADVPFDAAVGYKLLLDDMHKECNLLLDQRKSAPREQRKKFEMRPQAPVAAPAARPPSTKTVDNTVSGAAVAAPAADDRVAMASGAPVVVVASGGRRVRGDEYKGVVTVAGQTKRGTGESQYSTFCLTIHDGVREVPLFGTELERQASDLGIKPGDKVRVVFMGKAPTQVPGATRPSYKNLYQLTRTDGP